MCAGVQTGKLEEVAGIPHGQPTRHNPRSQRVKPECSVPCAPHHLGATCSHSQFTQSVVSQQTSTEPPPPCVAGTVLGAGTVNKPAGI